MERRVYREYSHCLNRDMEFIVYGTGGKPVLAVPSQDGRYFDFENFGMVEVCRDYIESGRIQLFSFDTMFKNGFIASLPASLQLYAPVVILALLTLVVKLLLDAYLATRSGFLLRATGDNPTLVASLAKDSGKVKILGLSIANALVALAGCVMCQYQRYFDISMGTGTLVLAVASVIVGTQLLRGMRFLGATLAVILGSILYKGCVALALSLGLSPFDLKLITAVLLLVIIVLGGHKRKVKPRA